MTPNPESAPFIKHEVPDNACEKSKRLSHIFHALKKQVSQGKWNGISEKDISLTYNSYNGCTKVMAVLHDDNNHSHFFIMQFVPNNGFGNEDSHRLIYYFEGKFDENAISIRSFAEYLSIHLQYEGFEPTLIECDKGLSMPCSVEYAYDGICLLIDITLSNIKPLVWFYTKEPIINTFDEVYYYMAGVQAKIQLESCKGNWSNVRPECFKLVKYENEKELSLELRYIVEEVWEQYISINVAQCDGYFDLFCTFNSYLVANLSNEIKRELDILFSDFLSTLKIAKRNTYIGCGERKYHSIDIQYFHIEDTFEIYCKMLDEIAPALQNFNFKLPLQPINLTEEIGAVKEQLETALSTTFEVLTEKEIINAKLNHGYFER